MKFKGPGMICENRISGTLMVFQAELCWRQISKRCGAVEVYHEKLTTIGENEKNTAVVVN